MPLDAALTVASGPRAVLFDGEGNRIPIADGEERAGHLSHFATCPGATAWRQGRPEPPTAAKNEDSEAPP